MIKVLLQLCIIFFIVLYMLFAFVNWDIVWVVHVDAVMRVTFMLFYVAICCIAAFAYLESKEKH
jgi:hypothetical protein